MTTVALSALIEETKQLVSDLANRINARYYEMIIGKNTTQPYFLDSERNSYVFTGKAIEECTQACHSCGEPIQDDQDVCPWCAIQDHHVVNAMKNNPLRMLANRGLLEDYYEMMNSVGKK